MCIRDSLEAVKALEEEEAALAEAEEAAAESLETEDTEESGQEDTPLSDQVFEEIFEETEGSEQSQDAAPQEDEDKDKPSGDA